MLERVKQITSMVFNRSNTSNRWLFFSPSERKFDRKVGDGSASSVVAAPLLWIGRNFPEAPPAMWRKMPDSGEEERVTGEGDLGGDHVLLELLERPTKYYSGSALWQATVMDWNLSGNAYWLKIRDAGGQRPMELWWTPSFMLNPVGDQKTFIKHYEYKVNGQTLEIPPEDVVHFRYMMDPTDPRKGRSPLSALLHEVFTDTEAADFTATLLSNMGVPGIVVAPKSDAAPGEEDVKATKAYFKGAFSGSRRGEPLVMSGPTSVAQFGFSPQQMSLREIRRIPEERVSAVLGVPAIVAGLGAGLDRSTFANYAEAREAAYQDNIIPAQRSLAEEVRFQLLPDFEPDSYRVFRFGFDLSNVRVLQEDRNALAQRLDVTVRGGWGRVSDARRALDLEVDDTDEIYLRPVNVVEVPVGEAMVVPPASLLSPGQQGEQPALPPGETTPPEPVPTSGSNGHSAKHLSLVVPKKARLTRMHSRLLAVLTRNERALATILTDELTSDFESFGQTCADVFNHMYAGTEIRSDVAVEQKIDSGILARMITQTVKDQMDSTLRKRFERHVVRTLNQTIEAINLVTGLGVGVSDPVQQKLLLEGGRRRGLIDIEKTTHDALFRAIDEGNQAGSGPVQIARSIRDEVPAGRFRNAGPIYRSQLIARTETNWAQNSSSLAAYRESASVDRVVAMDGADDPECADRDGQEFSFDEAEVEMANEHPNGTLAFAPVVAEGPTI